MAIRELTPDQTEDLTEAATFIGAGIVLLFVAAGLGTLTSYTPVLMDIAEWVASAVSLAASLAAFAVGAINLKMAVKS